MAMRRTIWGFSLIELIVVISILATLSIVGFVWYTSIQKNQYNSKRVADVSTIRGALDTYALETKTLPSPTANRSYYLENGGYAHSETSTGAYGVSSSFSDDILGKYALSEHPKDPDTGHFYAYGRTLTGKLTYDVATVLRTSDGSKAYVSGTYDGTNFPSLVKAYNNAGFVENNGTDLFPYNPLEKAVTATIVFSSWSVSATRSGTLVQGDTVTVEVGSEAILKISDWSEMILGSATSQTVLVLQDLKIDDSGLITKIKLALNNWEAWTKAPKLRDYNGTSSSFEIETSSAVAAVRGTIFGVKANGPLTTVELYAGSVGVSAKNVSAGTAPTNITVAEGGMPMRLNIYSGGGTPAPSPITNPTEKTSIEDKIGQGDLSLISVKPMIAEIERASNVVTAANTTSRLKITFTGAIAPKARLVGTGSDNTPPLGIIDAAKSVTFTFNHPNPPPSFSIAYCLDETHCGPERNITLGKDGKVVLSGTGNTAPTCPANDPFCDPTLIAYTEFNLWSDGKGDANLRYRNGSNTGLLVALSGGLDDTTYENYDFSHGTFFEQTGWLASAWPNYPMAKRWWAFYQWGNLTWVFPDNYNDVNDFIKYENLSSTLGLSNSFRIEIWVRWNALKRSDGTHLHYLFQSEKYYAFVNNSWVLFLKDNSGTLAYLDMKNLPWDQNTFYTVSIKKLGDGSWKLSINAGNKMESSFSADPNSSIGWWTYIWNGTKPPDNIPSNQWNDIIDFVKIYKE